MGIKTLAEIVLSQKKGIRSLFNPTAAAVTLGILQNDTENEEEIKMLNIQKRIIALVLTSIKHDFGFEDDAGNALMVLSKSHLNREPIRSLGGIQILDVLRRNGNPAAADAM